MREIKFRAWNIKEERMIQNIQQEYDGGEEDCFAQFIEQEASHGRSGEKGKYHVMQYTGLKDKNGVEIYEGDIVRSGFSTAVVEWDDDIDQDFYWGNACGFRFNFDPETGGKISQGYEVIGNIFEGVDK